MSQHAAKRIRRDGAFLAGNFVTRGLRLVTPGFAPSHLCSEHNNSIHNQRE